MRALSIALSATTWACGSAEHNIEVSAPDTPRGQALAMLTRQVQLSLSDEEGHSAEVSRRSVSRLGPGLTLEADLPEDAADSDSATWKVTAFDENGTALLSGSGKPSEEDDVVRIQLTEESL